MFHTSSHSHIITFIVHKTSETVQLFMYIAIHTYCVYVYVVCGLIKGSEVLLYTTKCQQVVNEL